MNPDTGGLRAIAPTQSSGIIPGCRCELWPRNVPGCSTSKPSATTGAGRRYPAVVIDELLGPEPAGLDVLDVGCGTGIASRQVAERGANVLGVEVAPRMAEIARNHGIEVEVAAFEDWDAAGRTFDRVISAQAWHWLDLPVSTAKAASLLRPGGRLCLFWSAGCHPDDLADALAEVYARLFPTRR